MEDFDFKTPRGFDPQTFLEKEMHLDFQDATETLKKVAVGCPLSKFTLNVCVDNQFTFEAVDVVVLLTPVESQAVMIALATVSDALAMTNLSVALKLLDTKLVNVKDPKLWLYKETDNVADSLEFKLNPASTSTACI
jgi:hypothetical protein